MPHAVLIPGQRLVTDGDICMLPFVTSRSYTLGFFLEANTNKSSRIEGRLKLLLVATCFTQEVEKTGPVGR